MSLCVKYTTCGKRFTTTGSSESNAYGGTRMMIEALFAVLLFVGIYVSLWYLFNRKDGGGVG